MSGKLGQRKLKEILLVNEFALKMGYDMSELDLDQCDIVVSNIHNSFDSDINQYLD